MMPEYIEREAIEYPYMTMTLWGLNNATCKAYNEGVKAAEDAIAAMPAADVEPVKHGRWIEHIDHEMLTGYDECSVCHFGTIGQSNYCPNCGAKMDGGDAG